MQLCFLFRHWILLVILLIALPAWADDLTQITSTPPAVYREQLAKLLTPLDTVLKRKDEFDLLHGDAGLSLLDEKITFVSSDGKLITVFHSVYKALNDAGVRGIGKGRFFYKKNTQRLYLVLAQSIQPDGTRDPIKNDALFLKTPQSQEGNDIYDDEIELDAVYSNIKPGSITESITVQEDLAPTIPGQFSDIYEWVSSWPEFWQRYLLAVPNGMNGRLKITNLGQGVPAPTRSNFGTDGQLLTWEKFNVDADTEDSSEAPYSQVGPLAMMKSNIPKPSPFWKNFKLHLET